jgi:hypothetical protein
MTQKAKVYLRGRWLVQGTPLSMQVASGAVKKSRVIGGYDPESKGTVIPA